MVNCPHLHCVSGNPTGHTFTADQCGPPELPMQWLQNVPVCLGDGYVPIEYSNAVISGIKSAMDDEFCQTPFQRDDSRDERAQSQQSVQTNSDSVQPNVMNYDSYDARITNFYKWWSSPAKRQEFFCDPKILIDSMVHCAMDVTFENKLQKTTTLFSQFDKEVLFRIICSFLDEAQICNFINFDVYLSGCINAYRRCQAEIGFSIMKDIKKYHADMKNVTQSMIDAANTFRGIQESMKPSVSKITEASSQLEAELKNQENKQAETSTVVAPEPKPENVSVSSEFRGYICSPINMILQENGKLDVDKTIRYNEGVSALDKELLKAIALMAPRPLSSFTQVSWNTLKKFNPADVNISPSERLNTIRKALKKNYSRLKPKDPIELKIDMKNQ